MHFGAMFKAREFGWADIVEATGGQMARDFCFLKSSWPSLNRNLGTDIPPITHEAPLMWPHEWCWHCQTSLKKVARCMPNMWERYIQILTDSVARVTNFQQICTIQLTEMNTGSYNNPWVLKTRLPESIKYLCMSFKPYQWLSASKIHPQKNPW